MSLNHIVRQYLFKNTKPSKYVENPWAPFRNGLPFCTQKCKIVSSISMFYDLPDPVQFAIASIGKVDDLDLHWTALLLAFW